jgi:hypothetical protein
MSERTLTRAWESGVRTICLRHDDEFATMDDARRLANRAARQGLGASLRRAQGDPICLSVADQPP